MNNEMASLAFKRNQLALRGQIAAIERQLRALQGKPKPLTRAQTLDYQRKQTVLNRLRAQLSRLDRQP
jgi:hypothetical protein